jgi:hypothetical protein
MRKSKISIPSLSGQFGHRKYLGCFSSPNRQYLHIYLLNNNQSRETILSLELNKFKEAEKFSMKVRVERKIESAEEHHLDVIIDENQKSFTIKLKISISEFFDGQTNLHITSIWKNSYSKETCVDSNQQPKQKDFVSNEKIAKIPHLEKKLENFPEKPFPIGDANEHFFESYDGITNQSHLDKFSTNVKDEPHDLVSHSSRITSEGFRKTKHEKFFA